ncbi:hypothetical protein D3C80_1889650 [compost metagenome]
MAVTLLLIKIHSEIFDRYPQEAEAFTIFLAQVFMMLFMGSADRQQVRVSGMPEQMHTLVNENIMHKEVRHAIQEYA